MNLRQLKKLNMIAVMTRMRLKNPVKTKNDTNDDEYDGFAFIQDLLCSIQDKPAIPRSWILLDSQSTVDFFSNTRLLDNIHDVKRLYCNAGRAIVTKKGYLKGYGTVSYHPKAISHILSLNNLQKKYKVTYNSSANSGCIVHKTDSNNCVFMSLKIRLIFSDIIGDTAHVLVNTGEKNRSKYMVKQYSQTNNVCLIQNIIGHPSTEEYINHVQKNVMTHLSRQAICEHKKVYQTDWHNTHHKRM